MCVCVVMSIEFKRVRACSASGLAPKLNNI